MSKLTFEQRLPAMRDIFESRGIMEHARAIIENSLLSAQRMRSIIRAARRTRDIKGDTAEIGCAAGGTSLLIALINGGKPHWACDTFTGLVDCGEHDTTLVNGDFSAPTAEAVVGRLKGRARVVAGMFPESAPDEMRDARYSFVHIDVDTYRSIHDVFAFFVPRMSPGGVIAVDDVIGRGTPGAKLAWSEINAGDVPWTLIGETDPQAMVRF